MIRFLTLFVTLALCSTSTHAATSLEPLCADSVGGYWHNFFKWWGNLFGSQSGVVMVALGVGALSLFIITRGKWRK